MPTLHILSAGAAQAVTERIVDAFKRDTGCDVVAQFGAVGAMKSQLGAGDATDVIILTRAMIDELEQAGVVERGSRVDLGTVSTGVAVREERGRAGCANLANACAMRSSRLGDRVPRPGDRDRRESRPGAHGETRVRADSGSRLRFFPNGYAAMRWLAESGGAARHRDHAGDGNPTQQRRDLCRASPGGASDEDRVFGRARVARRRACARARTPRPLLGRRRARALREAGYEAG